MARVSRANQIADVDVPALKTSVDDILAGKLGYRWYAAVRRTDQSFSGSDFQHSLEGSYSGFPELVFPEYTADNYTYIGAVATPLGVPEAHVYHYPFGPGGFGGPVIYDLTADSGRGRFQRLREPLFIGGVPYRVYVSGSYLFTSSNYSGATITLESRPQLASYDRYARATTGQAVPSYDSKWSQSTSAVVPVGGYTGSQYLHLLLLHGTAPAPTMVMWSQDGASNIPVTATGSLQNINGVQYAEYTSDTPVAMPGGVNDLIVLPERDGIGYWNTPFPIPNADVGFTYQAGFYHQTTQFPPTSPIDAAVLADPNV